LFFKRAFSARPTEHCAEKHLHRYLSEFDFRYSNRLPWHFHERGNGRPFAIKGRGLAKRLTVSST